MASVSLRGREDTWCVRLGTGSGRETEENVFLQRDCIQSLKTVIWDMNSLHGLSSIRPVSVMQQRRLASRSALVRLALTECRRPPTPPPPPTITNTNTSILLPPSSRVLTFGVTTRGCCGFAVAEVLRLLRRSPCGECWLWVPRREGPCRQPPWPFRLPSSCFLLTASVTPEEKCSNLIWKAGGGKDRRKEKHYILLHCFLQTCWFPLFYMRTRAHGMIPIGALWEKKEKSCSYSWWLMSTVTVKNSSKTTSF